MERVFAGTASENAHGFGAQRASSTRGLGLPPVVRSYWIAMLLLSAISAVASDIYYHLNLFGQCCTLAYDDPLFTDFWHSRYIFRNLHTIAFFTGAERFAYPAFSAVIYDALYHLGSHAQAIIITAELIVCTLAALLFFDKIWRIGLDSFTAAVLVASTLLFSYPLLYLLQSGNIEIFSCVLTAAGLWAVLKGNDNAAALLWAAAGATKIYPLILLGLFLSRAKWRSLLIGIAAFLIISVVSMAFVGPCIPSLLWGRSTVSQASSPPTQAEQGLRNFRSTTPCLRRSKSSPTSSPIVPDRSPT
jgi:Glycosyltransferase family 87